MPHITNNLFDMITYVNRLVESRLDLRIFSYVDNDFYNNEYSQIACSIYYQIQVREVTEYKRAEDTSEKNNLIYLKHIDNL